MAENKNQDAEGSGDQPSSEGLKISIQQESSLLGQVKDVPGQDAADTWETADQTGSASGLAMAGLHDLKSENLSSNNTMEVHHHPQLDHRPKPFKEYLLEGLMIFIAVMMGFIAENIREGITNREHVKELTS